MTCVRFKAPTGPRRGFICTDNGPLVDLNPDCPNAAQHNRQPSRYIAASNWADEMMQTHDQHECPGCGRLLIWKPTGGAHA